MSIVAQGTEAHISDSQRRLFVCPEKTTATDKAAHNNSGKTFISLLLEQLRWARKCYGTTQAASVQHTKDDRAKYIEWHKKKAEQLDNDLPADSLIQDADDYFNAYAYLSALSSQGEENIEGSFQGKVARLFNPDGTWKSFEEIFFGDECGQKRILHTMSFDELDVFLEERLKIVYEIADPSLNSVITTLDSGETINLGFNQHGLEHIKSVKEMTMQLLKAAGASPYEMKIALVAIWAHDLGNMLSRHVHALVSPRILLHLVPEIAESLFETELKSKSAWREIRRIIYFHNEKTIGSYLRALSRENSEEKGKKLSERQKVKRIRELFLLAAPALFVGDKFDLGADRETDLPFNEELGIIDPHRQVNVNGRTKGFGLSEDSTIFDWVLEFNPGKNPRFPQKFDDWVAQFWGLYMEKHLMTARCIFALFSKVKVFSITILDAQTGNKPMTFSFTLRDLRNKIEALRKKYPEVPKVDLSARPAEPQHKSSK